MYHLSAKLKGRTVGNVLLMPSGGRLNISSQSREAFKMHITVDEKLHGLGVGAYMYAAAATSIHNLGGVQSALFFKKAE